MDTTEIVVGDVCYLKSGSPALTATYTQKPISGKDTVGVQWMGENNELKEAEFPEVCLTKNRPPFDDNPPAPA